jgi:predicted type IV restriction endonuclease
MIRLSPVLLVDNPSLSVKIPSELSSPIPSSEGRHGKENLKPHFSKERWGFLYRIIRRQKMSIDIRKSLKKILPFLLNAKEENLNEADTSQRIIKVFEDVLGYEVMTEITREKQIKDKYVDLAVRIDCVTKFLVEVKAAGVTLRDRHIEQAERYASEDNIKWVVLSNGITWNLFHLEFEEGIEYVRAFSIDLSSEGLDESAEKLALLHRQSIIKGELDKFWERHAALSPASIGKAIFSEDILRAIRRLIRKSEGALIDIEDIGKALHDMLSTEAREEIGPLRIRRKRKSQEKRLEPRDLPVEPIKAEPSEIPIHKQVEKVDLPKNPTNQEGCIPK